jgi:hypothetical protein
VVEKIDTLMENQCRSKLIKNSQRMQNISTIFYHDKNEARRTRAIKSRISVAIEAFKN